MNAKGVYARPSVVISVTTNVFHEQPQAYIYVVGCSHYECLVAAYVTLGRIYMPLVVDAKIAWHLKG